MIVILYFSLLFEEVANDGMADGSSRYFVILDIAGLGRWDFPYVRFFTKDLAPLTELVD